MINIFTLCFVSFLSGGFIGMLTLLFMQGAFYKDAKKNESSRNKIK